MRQDADEARTCVAGAGLVSSPRRSASAGSSRRWPRARGGGSPRPRARALGLTP